jgi:hypothetical protein
MFRGLLNVHAVARRSSEDPTQEYRMWETQACLPQSYPSRVGAAPGVRDRTPTSMYRNLAGSTRDTLPSDTASIRGVGVVAYMAETCDGAIPFAWMATVVLPLHIPPRMVVSDM